MYASREVARVLGVSVNQVRAFVRAGFLQPERGARGELRFTFQDLVLLRAAQGLMNARISARRIRRALRKLSEQLTPDRPLGGVHISAEGDSVVVREGGRRWHPESGQVLFDFDVAEVAKKVAPLTRKTAAKIFDAAGWYDRGYDLEEASPEEAMAAYRRALQLDPTHVEAHVNLGRLLHARGDTAEALEEYESAMANSPADATAAFNLGVALEDLGRHEAALIAYRRALTADERCADAHYNVARLYEATGQRDAALRHWRAYQKLVQK